MTERTDRQARMRAAERYCTVGGCGRVEYAMGLCERCYQRARNHGGDPTVCLVDRSSPAEVKFWRKIEAGPVPIARPDMKPCALWTGALDEDGYGKFSPHLGQTWRPHLYVLHLAGIEVPVGRTVDHLCHTVDLDVCPGGRGCFHRRCAEVTHLEVVPFNDNTMRGHGPSAVNARKTHCIHGHEFTPENTYVYYWKGRPCRACRTCKRANPPDATSIEVRARSAVSAAVRKGILVRLPCEVCGALKVQAHHEDYSQPLSVRWLCIHHHVAEHHS